MKIINVASALPDHLYSQDQITDAVAGYWGAKLRGADFMRRLHSRVGVAQRYLAFPLERYPQFETWGQSNQAWLEAAEKLGAEAIDLALERAGLTRDDINALYVVSITGVASPSLDARLINRMGLRSDIKRTPIFGLGCVGGATGLVRAADHVRAFPDQIAIILSVELCSLTIQKNDLSTANMIAIGLFGDGAVAAVLAGRDTTLEGAEIIATKSAFFPGTEDMMGWDISENGFRIVLSPHLADFVKSRFASDVDAFLAEHGVTRDQIESWVIHPGGPKILDAVEYSLGFSNGELSASRECLARYGNLSSGSVLQVLEEVSLHRRPSKGALGIIAAMGPGFCAEMLLVRW
jgi:alkylresorcinol/alkylpyrone synthase